MLGMPVELGFDAAMSSKLAPLLAFGAHPDDIEFGCGGIVAGEALAGRQVHLVVCSRGEAGSNGTPAIRTGEAERAARHLRATPEFIELDGDAQLELKAAHSLKIAGIIRRLRPEIVLAPTLEGNQHPDHWRLGQIVRDATRLARYGGLAALKPKRPHAIAQLFFYAVSPDAEPAYQPVLIDVSARRTLAAWTKAMLAHASQLKTREYVDLQLARARVWGLRAGVGHAQPLWSNDSLVFGSLASAGGAARDF
jgi:LmbE family N-acetylglucosaminyl deacetylase